MSLENHIKPKTNHLFYIIYFRYIDMTKTFNHPMDVVPIEIKKGDLTFSNVKPDGPKFIHL